MSEPAHELPVQYETPQFQPGQSQPGQSQPGQSQPAHEYNHDHVATIHPIQSAPSARFATMARAAVEAARSLGLQPPGFMSPPRHKTADRTIRRVRHDPDKSDGAKSHGAHSHGAKSDGAKSDGAQSHETSCMVAVRVKGRPLAAIQADIIEGVIVANNLTAEDAIPVRTELWLCLTTLAADD